MATIVSKLEGWLKKGRRITHEQATEKWGLTRLQFNSALATLRRRLDIDADMVRSKRTGRPIASHQLVR